MAHVQNVQLVSDVCLAAQRGHGTFFSKAGYGAMYVMRLPGLSVTAQGLCYRIRQPIRYRYNTLALAAHPRSSYPCALAPLDALTGLDAEAGARVDALVPPDIVRVDAEGAELAVLTGMLAADRGCRARACVCADACVRARARVRA
jgi:hypothetical protein